MYDWRQQRIINSALDPNGTLARFTGTADRFTVTRALSVKASDIVSVDYTPYSPAVMEVATFTVPTFDTTTYSAIEVVLRVGLVDSQYSAYARNRLNFERDYQISINPTGTPATDAAAIAKALNSTKVSKDVGPVTVTANGAVLTFTAVNGHQKLLGLNLTGTYIDNNNSYWAFQATKILDTSSFTVTTTGKIGIGDDEWMQRTVKVPTRDNTIGFGLGTDSRPVQGGNYGAFHIGIKISRDWDTGLTNNGTYSTVFYTFYVIGSLVSAFQSAILTTFPGMTTRSGVAATTLVTTVNGTVATTASLVVAHTAQLGARTTNTVEYSSSNTAVATVDDQGLVTAIAAGTAVITILDVPESNSGTVTVTVTTS